jgi:hypothetical protein
MSCYLYSVILFIVSKQFVERRINEENIVKGQQYCNHQRDELDLS